MSVCAEKGYIRHWRTKLLAAKWEPDKLLLGGVVVCIKEGATRAVQEFAAVCDKLQLFVHKSQLVLRLGEAALKLRLRSTTVLWLLSQFVARPLEIGDAPLPFCAGCVVLGLPLKQLDNLVFLTSTQREQ